MVDLYIQAFKGTARLSIAHLLLVHVPGHAINSMGTTSLKACHQNKSCNGGFIPANR
jgi:hypothetical protein